MASSAEPGIVKPPIEEDWDAQPCSHPLQSDRLRQVQDQILPIDQAQAMAEFFGLLGDPNRLRLLSVLAIEEQCVGDLAQVLGMSESAVSHQLRILRNLRLVSPRRQGRHMVYRLLDHHVLTLYQAVAEHLAEVRADQTP